jgi:aldose 1-epimerase
MKPHRDIVAFAIALSILPAEGLAVGKYSVSKKIVEGYATYHLLDSTRHMDFGVVPELGNLGYEFKVNGKDVLIPPESLKSYVGKHRFCCGSPFLWPWANRIDRDYYYFQGKKYLLNDALGNLLRDQFQQVIHGLLAFESRWELAKTAASDSQGASLASRLDFYKYPDLIAQFPFAHTIEVTYQLKDGKLETTTAVHNVGGAEMPIMMAYHPYFHLDGDREQWRLSIGAATHWLLSNQLIATGETELIEKFLPGARDLTLGNTFLDDVFSGFDRDKDGFGHVTAKGRTRQIEVVFGKEFNFSVIYAPLPPSGPLICIEPQTGPTNSFNLNHDGKFPGLVALGPGKIFKASFWIIPTGY